MTFRSITHADQADFHRLLTAYYREGEDADTQQAEIDQFIELLFGMCLDGKTGGAIAYDAEPVGFVLFARDTADFEFSNLPGYGTILEIGVESGRRKTGLGSQLVAYAENALRDDGADSVYVCAYGPAVEFWKKCGYADSGRIAGNGLKIYSKDI